MKVKNSMKNNNANVKKILKYIGIIFFLSILSYGTAVFALALEYYFMLLGDKYLVSTLGLVCIFVEGFALPIISIIGMIKLKFLRENIWLLIAVSVLDGLLCYFSMDWLTVNLLVHGSEYTWWGFQLLWLGKILVVNGSVIVITLLVYLAKRLLK